MAEGGWAGLDAISQNIQILPADTLVRICKGPLVKFTLECQDEQKVTSVWQCLLRTFAAASTSSSHTTAACNAVSGFLDAALACKNHGTRQIALSHRTWLAVFEVYLIRFEGAKPKPMKQVLNSLVKILIEHPEASEIESIRSQLGDVTIPAIMLGEPRSRLKVVLLSLEILMRKNAISPSQLMVMVCNWLSAHRDRWMPLFEEHCKALSIGSLQSVGDSIVCEECSQITAVRIFTLGLLVRATSSESSSFAGAMLATLVQKMKTSSPAEEMPYIDPQTSLPIWVAPAKQVMLENLDSLENMSNHILYPLFSIDPSGFRTFIRQLPGQILLSADMTEAPLDQFTLLFSTLQIAKKLGLVHEDHAPSARNDEDGAFILKSEILGQFLLHREPSIRVATFSLLITAPSTTKPMTSAALRAIMHGVPALHADSDAHSRGQILSLTRRLLVRLRSGVEGTGQDLVGCKLEGSLSPERKTDLQQQQTEFNSRTFLESYVGFLEGELQATASYQRHITALKALSFVLQSRVDPRVNEHAATKSVGGLLPWRFSINIFRPSLFRVLVDLLIDPFDDVRATSLSLLDLFPLDFLTARPLSTHRSGVTSQLMDALSKAENLASKTSRADHADAVARLYHVLFSFASAGSHISTRQWYGSRYGVVNVILSKLEGKLSLAGGLFNSLMRDAPLHGYVSALRYIIATPDFYSMMSEAADESYLLWRTVHDRIVSVCNRIWVAVKPVLCVDSPEGHSDEPIEDLVVGPKDILSYSWRALRESSLLLHASLANPTYAPAESDKGLKRADYEIIGMSSFTQLAELRHRGAFSTVSQTFAACCQCCGQSADPSVSSLPEGWYKEARGIIDEQASRLTRRSAGLPALVTGILSSNPGGPLFQQVMKELHEISRLPATQDATSYEIKLPQVHAMNCLKDIFTNTRLGPHTEPFIMSALTISAECLTSSIWAIRNCGLMLFRALLTRMCRLVTGSALGFGGISGSESGSRIPFQKYPGLTQLLSGLLAPTEDITKGEATTATERVFPALELIGEKVPSISGDDDRMLRGLVLRHAKSSVWAIREHAARVYASLLNLSEILTELHILREMDISNQNFLHGRALCLRFALQRFELSSLGYWRDHFEGIKSTIHDVFSNMFSVARSPFVQAAILDILNDSIEKGIESGKEEEIGVLIDSIFETYDLSSRIDHLLDAFDPSVKHLSESRASSLLRRSLIWAAVLKQTISPISNQLPLSELFSRVSAVDSDAARWILGQMPITFKNKTAYRKQLLDLYTYVITGCFPEDVKACAMSNMASLLESQLDFRSGNISDLDVPWILLGDRMRTEYNTQTWSRETTDAELRLQGCLLTLEAASSSEWESSRDFILDLHKWATKLRYAMEEETEFTTRYSAVMSITSFARTLRSPAGTAKTSPALLDIYLILYDMLNDDDEELRDMSAAVASWVLSYSSISADRAISLAPLAASEALARFIASSYQNSSCLFRDAVRRLTGQKVGHGTSGDKSRLIPVSDLVSEYRKESTVLFVEEKQNLFIDDVREVDIWATTLSKLGVNAGDETMVRKLSSWVADGLLCFIEVTSCGEDGLLGWASKVDMFVLGVRVLSCSAILVSKGFMAAGQSAEDKSILKQRLQSLLDSGRAASLHDQWLSRIELALASS